MWFAVNRNPSRYKDFASFQIPLPNSLLTLPLSPVRGIALVDDSQVPLAVAVKVFNRNGSGILAAALTPFRME